MKDLVNVEGIQSGFNS